MLSSLQLRVSTFHQGSEAGETHPHQMNFSEGRGTERNCVFGQRQMRFVLCNVSLSTYPSTGTLKSISDAFQIKSTRFQASLFKCMHRKAQEITQSYNLSEQRATPFSKALPDYTWEQPSDEML